MLSKTWRATNVPVSLKLRPFDQWGGGRGSGNGKKIARAPNFSLAIELSRANFRARRAIFGPRAVILESTAIAPETVQIVNAIACGHLQGHEDSIGNGFHNLAAINEQMTSDMFQGRSER